MFEDEEFEDAEFKAEDLQSAPFQYVVSHEKTSEFSVGEKVFLKSNPEFPLTVSSLSEEEVFVFFGTGSDIQITSFPPQCLLQYKYRSDQVLNDEYRLNFN